MKKLLILGFSLLVQNIFADTININAIAHSSICIVNQPCMMSSVHDIEIINNNSENHKYNYLYSLCDDENHCHNTGYFVTVNAHSKWKNHYDNWFSPILTWNGTHQIIAETKVSGHQAREVKDDNVVIIE